MKKLFVVLAWLGVSALLGSSQQSYAQTPGQTTTDKTSQLATDFCAQLSLAQASGQTTNDETSQLANDFCAQLSLAKSSSEPVRIALTQTPSQPARLGIAQTSSEPTRLAAAQIPGQQPTDKTFKLAEDLNLSIGFRTWFTNWKTFGFGFSGGLSPQVTEFEDFSPAFIPTAGLRYKNFFVSASGMFGTDYHFSSTRVVPFQGVNRVTPGLSASRKEADFNVGYFIHPWIAVSLGYKGVFQDFRGVDYHFNGETVGAAVNIPIPEGGLLPSGFSLYGNGAGGYMWLNITPSSADVANHAFYGALEGGIAYKPSDWPLAVTAGYKYQAINTYFKKTTATLLDKDAALDTTRGWILGVTLVF